MAEIAGAYIGLVLSQHNIWFFNSYLLIEIWLVCTPALLLYTSKKLKLLALLLLSSSALVWLLNVYQKGIHVPANLYFLYYCITVLIIYLLLLFNSGIFNGKKLVAQPVFWIALSALLYFGCMIPYKGFELYLFANDMELARTLFNINIGLGMLRYLFLAVSFFLLGKGAKKNILAKHAD
ncbi:MAG: hypothetical protein R2800_15610 [Flavipsychrobacter sp.]